MYPYSYNNGNIKYNHNIKETTDKWMSYKVDFPSAYPSPYLEHQTVRGDYYKPYGIDNAPLVILVHGMGDHGVIPCHFLARTLVKKGFACFVLYQVFHSSRLPQEIKQKLWNLTPDEWFESYRISVIDVLQVIDWANHITEINQDRIAAVGISFGGFVSSIAMGIDKRIKASALMVSGGNSAKIAWKGSHRHMKGHEWTEAEYRQISSLYSDYLSEIEEKGFENVEPPRKNFLNDPLTFAPLLRDRPMMMINALWDKAVPKEAALDFWEACGKPQITWLPSNHPAIWLWYPLISRKIINFLSTNLGKPVRINV